MSKNKMNASNLDRSLLAGIAWTGAAKWLTQLLSWASTLMVARILLPEDYGLFGMATVYLGFVMLVSELGLGAAIITNRELTNDQIAQINSVSIMVGVIGMIFSFAVAFPLAAFFNAPDLNLVIIVMSANFIIAAFRAVPSAVLERNLAFKALAMIEGTQALVQTCGMLAFALLGSGYWALVAAGLLGSSVSTVMFLLRERPRFAWPDLVALKHVFSFSWHMLVMRLSWYSSSNADFIVAGRVLGQSALGAYTIAWTIAQVPVERITGFVTRVAFPIFSAVQHDRPALIRYVLSLTEGLGLVIIPLAVGLAMVADDLVLVALGTKWDEAILPLRVLAILTILRTIMPLLAHVLTVTGGTRLGMYNGIVTAIVAPVCFYAGSHWGIGGIALSWLVIQPFNAAVVYWYLARVLQLTPWQVLRALSPALKGSLVLIATLGVLKQVLPSDWLMLHRLCVELLAGGAAYIISTAVIHKDRVRSFVALIRGVQAPEPAV